jgi:hypothetical protein
MISGCCFCKDWKKANIWSDTGDSWDYAAVEREEPAFRFVHDDHRGPHPGHLLPLHLGKAGERRCLNRETCADNVEGIREGDRGNSCHPTTDETAKSVKVLTWSG